MAPTTPKYKKNPRLEFKKLPKAYVDKQPITDEDRKPGVVYVGNIPHGFFEKELFQYFSQFGKVTKLKLSRSKKTGNYKGYAFVKFRYAAVAKTVAETCNNYLFFNKLLKCQYKELDEVHEDTFHTYKWKFNNKPKREHNSNKSQEKLLASTLHSTRKQARKLKKLEELGVKLDLQDVLDVPTFTIMEVNETKDTISKDGADSSTVMTRNRTKRARQSSPGDEQVLRSKRTRLGTSANDDQTSDCKKTTSPKNRMRAKSSRLDASSSKTPVTKPRKGKKLK